MNRILIMAFCLVVLAGASSFLLGRQTAAPQTGPAGLAGVPVSQPCCKHAVLCNWLKLSEQQRQSVRATDPTFVDEAGGLRQQVEADRMALAALLENPGSSDRQIMDQIERAIASHDALERRVARHMLAIRPILTPEQAKQLMGLAASGVRNAGRCGQRQLGPQGQ
jgi:Spy/CpxP family protein refolding chaperone